MGKVLVHTKRPSIRSNKKLCKGIKEKRLSAPLQVEVSPTLPISVILPRPVHSERPTNFVLPDLVSRCKFELSYHPDGDQIAQASTDWLDSSCPDLNPQQRKALRGLQAGKLTAFCYTSCSTERLRVVSDFLTYLFHL